MARYSVGFTGGIRTVEKGIDPDLLRALLLRAVEIAGVRVFCNERVISVDPSGQEPPFRIKTTGGANPSLNSYHRIINTCGAFVRERFSALNELQTFHHYM